MANDALTNADQLYNKVKSLIQDTNPLDEGTARIIVESVDDAIKEFGSTNQEKKIELKQWKARAELILPPDTIDEFKKRAERQFLQKTYLRHRVARNILLTVLGITIIGFPVAIVLREAIKSSEGEPGKNKSTTPTSSSVATDEVTFPYDAPPSSAGEETDPEIRRYNQLLLNNPSSEVILYKRADKYRDRGKGNDLANAIADYTRLLDLKTDELGKAEVYLNRGHTYLKGEDCARANADFSEGITLLADGKDEKHRRLKLNLWKARGLSYEKLKIYQRAFQDFTMICDLDKDSEQCHAVRKRMDGWSEGIRDSVWKTYQPL